MKIIESWIKDSNEFVLNNRVNPKELSNNVLDNSELSIVCDDDKQAYFMIDSKNQNKLEILQHFRCLYGCTMLFTWSNNKWELEEEV